MQPDYNSSMMISHLLRSITSKEVRAICKLTESKNNFVGVSLEC